MDFKRLQSMIDRTKRYKLISFKNKNEVHIRNALN